MSSRSQNVTTRRPPAYDSAPVEDVCSGHAASFLKVTQGDRVVIALVSNEDTQVHLHAYDLKLQLEAGVPAELAFEAHHSGRFPAALHWPADGGHREDRALLYLEVYPQ